MVGEENKVRKCFNVKKVGVEERNQTCKEGEPFQVVERKGGIRMMVNLESRSRERGRRGKKIKVEDVEVEDIPDGRKEMQRRKWRMWE